MLSRRSLLASSAALAAGCSTLESAFSPPGLPKETEIDWAVFSGFISLYDPEGILNSDESMLQRGLAALAEDKENPYGPQRGRYNVTLRYAVYAEDLPELDPPPENREEVLEYFAALLDAFSADLVALPPFLARLLGEEGLVLPLDRFMGAEKSAIEASFFPSVLEPGRGAGGLYALPVGALPQMVTYDAVFFTKRGVRPPDGSWDWDDLVSNAARLTQRDADGEVTRWGVVTHGGIIGGIWWTLWQNAAGVLEPETMRCRLQEPDALEALQFFRDMLHTHRVSPAVSRGELYKLWTGVTPHFAMQYSTPALVPTTLDFPLAELPRGKVHAVPVSADLSIAIAARTEKAEAAYTALRGVVGVMQERVHVPAEREALARLGEFRKRLRPDEVTAIQRSMEHGHAMPQFGVQYAAMGSIMEGLVRGDDVATVVGTACARIGEHMQFCEANPIVFRCLI